MYSQIDIRREFLYVLCTSSNPFYESTPGMRAPSHLLKNLRSNLSAVLANEYSQAQLDELVALSHTLAVSSIYAKLSAGKLNASLLGLNHTDLAYDCIADLFRRDENGVLLQIKVYFQSYCFEDFSDEMLLAHLRRLVFARVAQGLFRLYNEVDPALGKILRNMKLALNTIRCFAEVERFGETYITPNICDPLRELPEINDEELEHRLRCECRGNERIPEILSKLSRHLREQTEFCREVRLLSVAYVIRSFLSQPHEAILEEPSAENNLLVDDALATIHRVCERVRLDYFPNYVGKKKTTGQDYDSYFLVIAETLKEKLIGLNGEESSLYERLKSLSPHLTKEEYRRRHKNVLEYLTRQTYEQAVAELRKE